MASSVLSREVQDEIARIAKNGQVDVPCLERLAYLVLETSKKGDREKALGIGELKQGVYRRFNVENTDELKNSGRFKMATDGMGKFDFRLKSTWEMLYRRFVGVLPNERHQQGYGCINGVNVFDYFKPWQVFGLDPKASTKEDIKAAYRRLSKIYHPDNPNTGDREIFERIGLMYRSIVIVF